MVLISLQNPIHDFNFYESSTHMIPSHKVQHLHEDRKKTMKNKNLGTNTKSFVKENGSGSNIKGIGTSTTSSADFFDSSLGESQSSSNSFPSNSWSSLSNSHSNLCSNPSINLNSYYDNISFLFEQQELSKRKFGALSRKEIESISQSNSLPRSRGPKKQSTKKMKRTCSRPTRVKALDSSYIEYGLAMSNGAKKNTENPQSTSSRVKTVNSFIDEELTVVDDRMKRMITKKVNRIVEKVLQKIEIQSHELRIKTSQSHLDEIELELC